MGMVKYNRICILVFDAIKLDLMDVQQRGSCVYGGTSCLCDWYGEL